MITRTRLAAIAATAALTLGLAACGGDESGKYDGFDTAEERADALDKTACALAKDGNYAVQAYNAVREDPELSERYGIPESGDAVLLHKITYGQTTYDCDAPWVRAGAAAAIDDNFDREMAEGQGVIDAN